MLIEITYNVTDVYMSTTETPVYVEISFEQPGSASAVWGSITGTLSNQTDLQNALNLKVPYTGATTNVNLGEYELKAGQVTLDTSPTGTAAVGTIRWNDTTGTSETTLKGGNVIIKNGVDLVARVVNKVLPNTTLTKAAYQAVRVSGAQGQRLAIELAQANNDAGSADTIGLVTETIAPNQEGFIMTVGQLEGINTTGSLQGETWVDGDVLYLSPTTAGALTNIKPTAVTGHIVVVGYVEYAHANNGKIYVKVMNGWELDELHNVSIITPTNNQGLFYNSTSTLWENKSITTALGYTPVPTTRNITINGVTYDLSADRTWTIAAGISGSGASGQVTYWTGASAVSGSNNLFWDNTNGRLGIGTNAPLDFNLVVQGAMQVRSIASAFQGIRIDSTSIRVRHSSTFSLGTNDSAIAISMFAPTNNVGINTTSDLGVRFGVIGDTLLRGSGATDATTALTVQNSSSTNILRIRNNGEYLFGNSGSFVWAWTYSSNYNVADLNGTNFALYPINGSINLGGGTQLATSGNANNIITKGRFAPSSGTATFADIRCETLINQTGGANGITRGLYVNPTLTAAADFRAIETTAGNVLFGSNFFWDNANGRLAIGAATTWNAGIGALSVVNGTSDAPILSLKNTDASKQVYYASYNDTNKSLQYIVYGSTAPGTIFGQFRANAAVILGYNTPSYLAIGNFENVPLIFGNNNQERFRVTTSGNVSIGTTSDLAVRLGVVGDTLLRGSGNTSATTALTVQNSSSTNLLLLNNAGNLGVGVTPSAWATTNLVKAIQLNSGSLWNFQSSRLYLAQNLFFNGTDNIYYSTGEASSYEQSTGRHIWYTAASGTGGATLTLNQRMTLDINGLLGIGQNTPTALADIGASTTTRASLRIRSGTAPTTPNDGDIWFDGTDIKMRIGGVTKTFTLV